MPGAVGVAKVVVAVVVGRVVAEVGAARDRHAVEVDFLLFVLVLVLVAVVVHVALPPLAL